MNINVRHVAQRQVEKSHYDFNQYMSKKRWISVWHQVHEVIALEPETVLEIGPGPGIFKNAGETFGLIVKTLDIDPDLSPDYVASADSIPASNNEFDVVCAFQVLEHFPFDFSMNCLREMSRVAKKAVIISLPDSKTSWPSTLTIPKLGTWKFVLQRFIFNPVPHEFDGEHYWEINKKGTSLDYVLSEIKRNIPAASIKTYRVHENQYHRFFIIKKMI